MTKLNKKNTFFTKALEFEALKLNYVSKPWIVLNLYRWESKTYFCSKEENLKSGGSQFETAKQNKNIEK